MLALAGTTVDSLAAAGHANIYFLLLVRTARSSRAALALLRPLGREIARYPELRIEWLDDVSVPGVGGPDAGTQLADALAGHAPARPARHRLRVPDRAPGGCGRAGAAPSSSRTFPPISTVRARAIQRVAAQSMLQDDPTFAPYGWTHCLTLSQAAIGIRHRLADPAPPPRSRRRTSWRSAPPKARHTIDAGFEPPRPGGAAFAALDAEPLVAAGAVFHASDEDLDAIVPESRRAAGATTTRTWRSTRSRASTPRRPTPRRGACTSRPRRTSARGGR